MPYVVGQWVRGINFYGREREITALCEVGRNATWVAGTRRIGKSSLLKQLEHLCGGLEGGLFPLFWDLQGAASGDELAASLDDALLDAEERLDRLGIAVGELLGRSLPGSLTNLPVALGQQGSRLLLLVDEAEELLALSHNEGEPLVALAQVVTAGDARAVLASSVRLCRLVESDKSGQAPLAAFAPPLYLAGLTAVEAAALLRQEQRPADQRPGLDTGAVEEITRRCGGHPYLLQLVAKRFLELGDVAAACETLAGDRMVSHLFAADLALLDEDARHALLQVARQEDLACSAGSGTVTQLVSLGLIRRNAAGRLEPGNWFLDGWLRAQPLQ